MGCIRWKKLGKGTYIDLDATKAEIRKLLPPRPSVTREEIDAVVEKMWNTQAPLKSDFFKEAEIRLISELFKSKGIEVKGEK